MKMKIVECDAKHAAFMDDLKAVLKKHGEDLTASEMLAICAQLTGQVLALQDQRAMSPEMGIQIIGQNLEIGNSRAIEEVRNSANTRPI
ncbi:hypothetical protein ABDF71_21765 [Ochrobactrum sp. WV_118_8]